MSSLIPPLPQGAAAVAADYTKRWADEHVWDDLIGTQWGRRLMRLSQSKKHGVELALYVLNAIVRHNIGDNTPFRSYLNEVIGDAAPEIAHRILHGPEIGQMTETAPVPDNGLAALIGLPEQERDNILTWFAEQPLDMRRFFINRSARWDTGVFQTFAHLQENQKNGFMELAGFRPAAPNKVRTAIIGGMDEINARLDRWAGKK